MNNDLFANHSWYFRNALVRANYENLSKAIYRTDEYLIRFLSNLIYRGSYVLKNRALHVLADTAIDTVKPQVDTVNDTVLALMRQNNKITANELGDRLKLSLSTVRRKIRALRNQGKIERIGSDKTGFWKILK